LTARLSAIGSGIAVTPKTLGSGFVAKPKVIGYGLAARMLLDLAWPPNLILLGPSLQLDPRLF